MSKYTKKEQELLKKNSYTYKVTGLTTEEITNLNGN